MIRRLAVLWFVIAIAVFSNSIVSANSVPDCSGAYPSKSSLWPPNHKFSTIRIRGISHPAEQGVNVTIQCIKQDEPLNTTGEGNTQYDGIIPGNSKARLRKERAGNRNGRVYHVYFTATAEDGGHCRGSVQVGVNKNRKKAAVDDGPLYDSARNNGDCDGESSNRPPTADNQTYTVAENTRVDITLTGNDPDNDFLSYHIVSQPSHGVLQGDGNDPVYIPDAHFAGQDEFTYIINDGEFDSNIASVTINVVPVNTAPVALDQTVATAEDTPIDIVLSGTDADGDALTFIVVTQPANGSLQVNDSMVSYTPDIDFSGVDEFIFIANDETEDSLPAIISIIVTPANDPPAANNQSVTTAEDTPVNVLLTGSDPEGDDLTYIIDVLPTQGTLQGIAPNLIYVPNARYAGVDNFTFHVNDGNADSSPATVSVDIIPANTAPVALDQTAITTEDIPIDIVLTATDADGDPLTFVVATQPENGSVQLNGPIASYTPNSGFSGADQFTFIANDETEDSLPAIISITVTSTNKPPVANNQSVNTPEDTPVSILLTANDSNGDTLTYTLLTQPTNGFLTGDVPDLLYTPDDNFNGTDEFTFSVNDGEFDSNVASVSITVTPENDPPVADDQSLVTDEDTLLAIQLTGSDLEGDVLIYQILSQPINGQLQGIAPDLTYVPNQNYFGSDEFEFSVNDGANNSLPATITIVVNPVNDSPKITSTPTTAAEEGRVYFYDAEAVDLDGDALIFSLVSAPTGMIINSQTGEIAWTPPTDQTGDHNIEILVDDGNGGFDNQPFTVSVQTTRPNNPPTIISNPETLTVANELYRYFVIGEDPDGDTLTYILISGPPGMVVDSVSGKLSWVPTSTDIGTQEVIVEIDDGRGGVDQQTFNLIVVSVLTNQGNDFWAMFLHNYEPFKEENLKFYISSEYDAAGTVSMDGIDDIPFSVNAGELTTVFIPPYTAQQNDTVANHAIHIVSDYPVVVYGMNQQLATTDGFTSLPTALLGNEYVVAMYTDSFWGGQFGIVATEDDTQIEITPTDAVDRKSTGELISPGESYAVVLNKGETYFVKRNESTGNNGVLGIDYTGTKIIANQKIAVFSGNKCDNVPIGDKYCDHLVEQLIPLQSWGSEYFTVPLATRERGDRFRVVAAHDNTILQINGEYVATIAAGSFYETVLTSASQIKANHPVSVFQFSHSNTFDSDLTGTSTHDPFMVTVPPFESAINKYIVSTPQEDIEANYFNVVLEDTALSSLTIDGVPVDPLSFVPLENNFYYAQLAVDVGAHAIESDQPFVLYAYGFDRHDSYGYIGGVVLGNVASITALSLSVNGVSGAPAIVNFDEETCALATVANEIENPIKSVPLQFTISGSTNLTGVRFTGDNGEASFCYHGHAAGDETVEVSVAALSITQPVQRMGGLLGVGNHPPIITSTPVNDIFIGQAYEYAVQAVDYDNDVLNYQLATAPIGMVIDSATGVISWNSPECSLGDGKVTVDVTDGNGGIDSQTYQLNPNGQTYNDSPVITGIARVSFDVRVGVRSEFYVNASHPQNFSLGYSLSSAPDGMEINGNRIHWIPQPSQVGSHEAVVEVHDEYCGSDTQTLELTAFVNTAPTITSDPITTIPTGHSYRYAVQVDEPDPDDRATLELLEGPDGMSFSTSALLWDVPQDGVGEYNVVIRAYDRFGGSTLQEFVITVTQNQAPVFNSMPVTTAITDHAYLYILEAEDPDQDRVTYEIVDGPTGMTLSSKWLRWTPTVDQIGPHNVDIKATDTFGGDTVQSFVVTVAPNQAPLFITEIASTAVVGHFYSSNVVATDPDNDAVYYELDSGPPGMTLVARYLRWTPTVDQVGANAVIIKARDNYGGETLQNGIVNVVNGLAVISAPSDTEIDADSFYTGLIVARAPNNPRIHYRVLQGPDGLRIGGSSALWTPRVDQQGVHDVLIEVYTDTESVQVGWTLTVTAPNSPPHITSTPDLQAYVSLDYEYQVTTDDADGDPLTYRRLAGPSGLGMSTTTGLITWTPTVSQLGDHLVRFDVKDGKGGVDTQEFTITVDPRPNTEPEITSVPGATAYATVAYQYDVNALDADGDTLIYSLIAPPIGMTIDSVTGEINWTPAVGQEGAYSIDIEVDDGWGGVVPQSYTLNVKGKPNQPPVFSSAPIRSAKVDENYRYGAIASDPDGDLLTYALIQHPTGMSIDAASGLVNWTPNQRDVGGHGVTISVTDVSGASASQSFTLNVFTNVVNLPLDVMVSANPQRLDVDETTTVMVSAKGGEGNSLLDLLVNGSPVTLDANHKAVLTPSTPGYYELIASATDDTGLTVESRGYFTVNEPSDIDVPVARIDTPAADAEITAPVDIVGTASDANLAFYRLSISPKDANRWSEIAYDTLSVTDGVLGNLDPSQYQNGLYDIKLVVTDAIGQETTDTVSYVFNGDLKVGHFSFTVQDLNIPVFGVPITVNRTYDTRRKGEALAFGHGWRIDYQNVKVEENTVPGKGWEFKKPDPFQFCLEPTTPHFVTITLPDGRLEEFEVSFAPLCNRFTPPDFFSSNFIPRPGTTSRLYEIGNPQLRLNGNDIFDFNTLATYNPSRYELVTVDGFKYQLDQDFGIRIIQDPNGNLLQFSEDGIIHSSGKGIHFERDPEGRIIKITDPNGESLHYQFDGNGDLRTVTDREGNFTGHTYNRDHGLVEYIDPRGQRPARNIYDEGGRLIATEDGEGNRIEFSHDIAGRQEIVTDRLGNVTLHVYDDDGNVLTTTDALGQVTSYTYDADGNELSVTDPLGNVIDKTYDANGNVLTETDALGHVTKTSYYYDQPSRITDANGHATQFQYSSKRDLIGITDALTHKIANVYDKKGNLTQITDALGHSTEYVYNFDGYRTEETDANGNVITYTYDENGNELSNTQIRIINGAIETITETSTYNKNDQVVTQTDALGGITETTYTPIGKVATQTDKNGNVTRYVYDIRGNEAELIYADGTKETKEYDAEGTEIQTTDRAGRVTEYQYDALKRLTRTTFPDGSTTQNEYDGASRLIAETDARGNRTQFEYDAAGRRIKTTDALGNETTFVYDAAGNQTRITDANGNTTQYQYDAANRRIQTIFPDGTTQTVVYDANGQKTQETDQAGNRTRYTYDESGQLTKVTDALNNETQYGYDEQGNKISQIDAEGRETKWAYDKLGRVISRTLPLGQIETFEYDANGNRISHTDFNSNTTTFQYDVLNQLVLKTYADTSIVTYTYTTTGQVNSITDQHGTTTHQYDIRNRLTQVTYPDGNEINYGYDQNGNRISVSTGTGTTNYTFDALNRMQTVTDHSGGVTTYTYDNVGNRSGQTHANGTTTNYVYNSLNRLTNLTHRRSDNSIIESFTYTLGAAGNRTKVEEDNGRTVDYTYDSTYKLLSETETKLGLTPITTSYAYDKVGNRQNKSIDGIVGVTYSYDQNDKLLTENTTSYQYDNNGNTTQKLESAGTTTYQYDLDNRLIQITTPTDNLAYTYDAEGIKQSQTVNGTTTKYLIDKNRPYAQVLEERDFADITFKYYVFGDDLLSQTQTSTANSSYFHYDGLGSTRILTDNTEATTDTYTYEAFGELIDRTGTTENDYLFAGEQWNPNLGFYYLRARFYNPANGRFTQQDVWPGLENDPITLHKYLYAYTDPINVIDPSGYIGLGGVSVSIGTLGNLYTVASVGFQIYTGNYTGAAKEIAEEVVFSKLGGAFGRRIAGLTKTQLSLFYNVFRKGLNGTPKLGLPASPRTLEHNLKVVGVNKPTNSQAHHIVGAATDAGVRTRARLKALGIDVNSATNGVFLPGCKTSKAIGMIHCGKHTTDYEIAVERALKHATDETSAINILNDIRIELLNNTFTPLNRRSR